MPSPDNLATTHDISLQFVEFRVSIAGTHLDHSQWIDRVITDELPLLQTDQMDVSISGKGGSFPSRKAQITMMGKLAATYKLQAHQQVDRVDIRSAFPRGTQDTQGTLHLQV